MTDQPVRLRAFTADDLPFLDRLCVDPAAVGHFEWPGFIDPRSRRQRWEKDAYIGEETTALAVTLPDDTVVGLASWRVHEGGAREIGLVLLPEYRGRGLGTSAQRQLVDHLLDFTPVHRLEAWTDAENLAEQKALERIGFQREGLLRGTHFQHGGWRDSIVYGLLRPDARPSDRSTG